MATRMQRYNQADTGNSRSSRNKELYRDIYEYGEYTNIEGIASIGRTNEIDITQVRDLLNNRENYQKRREYQKTIKKDIPIAEIEKDVTNSLEEERNYDIRDILVKAKETMPKDDKERVLRDSKYEFLNKIKKEKEEEQEEDLKELINTITSTSMLNKLGDATLAGELFGDLVAKEDEKVDTKTMKEMIEETKKEGEPLNKTVSMDNSFFTSSLNLSKSDFVDDDEEEKEKTSIFSIIIIVILVIIILGCAGILIYKRFM